MVIRTAIYWAFNGTRHILSFFSIASQAPYKSFTVGLVAILILLMKQLLHKVVKTPKVL